MKKTLMACALFLSAGLVSAQAPPAAQAPAPVQPSATDDKDKDAAKGEKHKMKAEVVSTNASAKTITVKNLAMDGAPMGEPAAGEVTLKLDTKATDRIASLKAGDKVTLTCKGDTAATTASAHCQTVTDINK